MELFFGVRGGLRQDTVRALSTGMRRAMAYGGGVVLVQLAAVLYVPVRRSESVTSRGGERPTRFSTNGSSAASVSDGQGNRLGSIRYKAPSIPFLATGQMKSLMRTW